MTIPSDDAMVVCRKCRQHRRPGNDACPHCGHEPGRAIPPSPPQLNDHMMVLYGPPAYGLFEQQLKRQRRRKGRLILLAAGAVVLVLAIWWVLRS